MNQHWLFQMVLSVVVCHTYCATHKELIQFHIMCAGYKCWHSCMLISKRKYFRYCLCLLLASFLPRSMFFSNESLIFFPTLLFCLAKFWGPHNNLEGNLGKKQNRSWISCLSPFLHSFKKTTETFQRSSKRGSRTFGADVSLWHVTGNEW